MTGWLFNSAIVHDLHDAIRLRDIVNSDRRPSVHNITEISWLVYLCPPSIGYLLS
jgi:hypothetical protein